MKRKRTIKELLSSSDKGDIIIVRALMEKESPDALAHLSKKLSDPKAIKRLRKFMRGIKNKYNDRGLTGI